MIFVSIQLVHSMHGSDPGFFTVSVLVMVGTDPKLSSDSVIVCTRKQIPVFIPMLVCD